MLKQYKKIHTLLEIPYLQPPHPTVRHHAFVGRRHLMSLGSSNTLHRLRESLLFQPKLIVSAQVSSVVALFLCLQHCFHALVLQGPTRPACLSGALIDVFVAFTKLLSGSSGLYAAF
jgi:hypothetical protein